MNKKSTQNRAAHILSPSWQPTHPVSRGATAYHEAVATASWHVDNIQKLIELTAPQFKKSEVVVDFGAGTGSSALYLLKSLPAHTRLFLVDNSASWLGKAYELLHTNSEVTFYLLTKTASGYQLLDEVLGKQTVDHVTSANTVHLIPQIAETFAGVYSALKKGGTFTIQSGNIAHDSGSRDVLTIDDVIGEIHDTAIELITTNPFFEKYTKGLSQRIQAEVAQRKFVFPTPRPLEFYLQNLTAAGFRNVQVTRHRITVHFVDWLAFLRVRRLQAGILPEVGGTEPTEQEAHDRDALITEAALQVFEKISETNPLATATSFMAEWTYVQAEK